MSQGALRIPLVILGTHWLAEELFDLVSEMPDYELIGFIENREPERCRKRLEGLPVWWVDDLPKLGPDVHAVCGISTTQRWQYVEQVRALDTPFATLRHPTARISAQAWLGEGCVVSPFCNISTKTELGGHVFLNRGVLVGHHTRIGDYCSLMPGANVAGLVTIGPRTYVGMGAVIRDRVTIGEGCVIGAGAVVTKDLPDHVLALGVPARIVEENIEGK